MRFGGALITMLLACGCAGNPSSSVPGEPPAVAVAESAEAERGEPGEVAEPKKPLLDRTQQAVYDVVNTSSKWVDGFFGTADLEEGENVSRGRLSVGTQWDQRDSFQDRVRLKARFPLTAMKQRLRLLVGRGDAEDFVDGRGSDNIDTLPERFNEYDEEDWLFGLGYSPDAGLDKGWDASVGVRLSTPVEPYVRTSYRWNKNLGDEWLWRMKPVAFWQNQRGPGVSVSNTMDHALGDSWLLRWYSILSAEREVDGMGWTSQIIAYQSLRGEDAFAYSVFASGENRNEVPLQNYGVEVRYRRQILREWFFVELSTRLTWPRETLAEQRESNFGLGIEFELQFGDWPGRKQAE